MTRKTAAYWEGRNAEAARLGSTPSVADLAQQVALSIGRDEARKRVIYARSPDVFSSMDGNEFGEASSVELALRELKALGIEPGDNDPLAILDAHHAGRKYARDRGTVLGGCSVGSASDSADTPAFLSKYLEG